MRLLFRFSYFEFAELKNSVNTTAPTISPTTNNLISSHHLFLYYTILTNKSKVLIKADDTLKKASQIEINLIEVEADDIGFKIDGKTLSINGLRNPSDESGEKTPFNGSYDRVMETPDIVLKKYKEMKNK